LLSPTERTLRAKIGAHSLHALHDSRITSAPGRSAASEKLNERLLSEIDPNDELTDAERARRLEHARSAYFSKLALQRSKARRKGVKQAAGGQDRKTEARS
jgi:hypothetical protein